MAPKAATRSPSPPPDRDARTPHARFAPDGYNVGWNCGATGGQEVFHAHLHVLPRFVQEPLAGKGIRAFLKSDANRW